MMSEKKKKDAYETIRASLIEELSNKLVDVFLQHYLRIYIQASLPDTVNFTNIVLNGCKATKDIKYDKLSIDSLKQIYHGAIEIILDKYLNPRYKFENLGFGMKIPEAVLQSLLSGDTDIDLTKIHVAIDNWESCQYVSNRELKKVIKLLDDFPYYSVN